MSEFGSEDTIDYKELILNAIAATRPSKGASRLTIKHWITVTKFLAVCHLWLVGQLPRHRPVASVPHWTAVVDRPRQSHSGFRDEVCTRQILGRNQNQERSQGDQEDQGLQAQWQGLPEATVEGTGLSLT